MKEITKRKGEIISRQYLKGSITYPKEESNYLEISTITEIPPENSQIKDIKLTVPIKGEHWCWLCKSQGPEKICPRKDEIGTEYGRQRLKELLQEMVKPQEKLRVELDKNGVTSGVNQEAWLLEIPSYSTEKGELIGPKTVQPPQGKTPHIKPVELGVEPSGHLNQQPLLHQKVQVVWWDNPLQNIGRNQLLGGVELEMIKRRNNSHLGLLLKGMVVMEMMMIKVMMMRRTKILKQSLRVKMGKKNNVPGGGGGGGDEPSSNPGGGNVGPRGKRGHRSQRGR